MSQLVAFDPGFNKWAIIKDRNTMYDASVQGDLPPERDGWVRREGSWDIQDAEQQDLQN